MQSRHAPAFEHQSQWNRRRVLKYVVGCAVAFALIGWVISTAARSRALARRYVCSGRLCGINQALYQYHDEHGCFPPAVVAGADGKPMHSWRILILKYIDPYTYEAYDFQEPWNGPKNRQLINSDAARYFQCPDGSPSGSPYTDYVAVVGICTAFPGTATTSPIPMAHYEGETGFRDMILIVETVGSDIAWTEPRDLEFDKMSFRINDPERPSIASRHGGGANVLLRKHSSGFFISEDTNPNLIKALLTVDGQQQSLDVPLWLPSR
jgi:hypothetical protein